MNNISHITQMLKYKIVSLESQGEESNSTGSRGSLELNLMRGPTRRQSNQSEKAEIANYCYKWQILKPSGKRKVKNELHNFLTSKGVEEKATLKGTTEMARLRGSARSK
jgi:hypothetical protein